jgi:NAD(P)-dependent dehydrogenase (short-subunit alcohol dehydrogenase family)
MTKRLLAVMVLTLLSGGAWAALKPDAPTVLITGANRGIGLEIARQYAAKNWNVIATSRRSADDPGLAQLRAIAAKHPQVAIERIDVIDTKMIRGVAEKYRNQPIDVLVNNAAAVEMSFQADMAKANLTYDKIDFDAALYDFNVTTLGPMRMAQAFMPHVERSKHRKIVNISSLAGSFQRGLPGGIAMNYGSSKAALNKYSVLLSEQVKPKGVIVALFQPVFIASKQDMKEMKNADPVDREVGKLIRLIDTMGMERSGKITNFTTGEFDPF